MTATTATTDPVSAETSAQDPVAPPTRTPPATPATPATGQRPLRGSAPPRSGRPAGYPEAGTRPRVRKVRVGREGVRRTADDDAADLPERPLRENDPAPLPDPTAQCCAVVRAAVEVLRGERPSAQLARWVTPQVRDQLAERARIALAHDPRSGGEHHRPVQVRRVRLVRLGDDVAEATVVLDDDGRVRAAAVRLEARRGAWRVAVLEVG
ncbi:Rv3235 family protein [Isoptericola sp. NPDC055881]